MVSDPRERQQDCDNSKRQDKVNAVGCNGCQWEHLGIQPHFLEKIPVIDDGMSGVGERTHAEIPRQYRYKNMKPVRCCRLLKPKRQQLSKDKPQNERQKSRTEQRPEESKDRVFIARLQIAF